jgi:hypothetical protein
LEYFGENLPGYDEHCFSITSDLYHSLTCQKYFKYFSSKPFLKQHMKTVHSNERAQRVPKERVAKIRDTEEFELLLQDYECNVESSKDKENSNCDIRNDAPQKFQEEKQKKGKSRARIRGNRIQ